MARADIAYGTIPGLVFERARTLETVTAIDDYSRQLTYSRLGGEVEQAACGLIALGLHPGDRVGIWAPNSAEWIVAAVAVHAVGAVLVPVNTRFKGDEATYVLRRSGCKALVVGQSFLGVDYLSALREADPEIEASLIKILMPGSPHSPSAMTWESFIAAGDGESSSAVAARLDALGAGDPADIIFTSGTTGHPKGVVLTHGQSLRAYEAFNTGFGLRAGDRYLITNPFFHCFGYKAGWMLSFLAGATALPHAVFDARDVLERIERDRVTVIAGPPTMFTSILDLPGETPDLPSLRYAFTAASSIPVTLVRRMQAELSVEVGTGYGLTESTAIVTVTRPGDSAETVASTVGSPVEGIEVRIVDDHHEPVAVGHAGEVAVRGFNVMSGYWEDPDATARVIDADGWLYTGDVGALDSRNDLRITDRIKDIIIVGGFNVSPVEVESFLLSEERVAQVSVVGAPDDRLGEVAAAFVVPRTGSRLTSTEIVDWARAHLANYKVPRYVEIVDSLPVNASGKIQKTELRSRAAAALPAPT